MKTYSVKNRVANVKKVLGVNYTHYDLEIICVDVDFKKAKEIMKDNKGSTIFPYKKMDLQG